LTQAAAIQLAEAAGLELVDRPIELTDPLKTWMSINAVDGWLSLEEDMWPDRAGELMGFVRRGYELSEDMTIKSFARRMRYRHRLEAEVAAIFADIDVLLTPSTAVPAFPAEGPMPVEINGVEVVPGMAVPFTMLANLCWNPAISLPAGLNSEGLPVGLQVIGRRHRDEVVLRLARIFEQLRPWPRFAPSQ
jgi:aspartyl-tRNA(Asn)/glutamyl-tRNA(Gln) amidotransferase subunit A